MNSSINVTDVVALVEDLPAHGLHRGQVGTVVEALARDTFEVEFSDSTGRAYAMAPVKAAQLMVLRYEPTEVAS